MNECLLQLCLLQHMISMDNKYLKHKMIKDLRIVDKCYSMALRHSNQHWFWTIIYLVTLVRNDEIETIVNADRVVPGPARFSRHQGIFCGLASRIVIIEDTDVQLAAAGTTVMSHITVSEHNWTKHWNVWRRTK